MSVSRVIDCFKNSILVLLTEIKGASYKGTLLSTLKHLKGKALKQSSQNGAGIGCFRLCPEPVLDNKKRLGSSNV